MRSYTDEMRQQTLESIKRIVRGQALAAGVAEDRLPEVKVQDDFTPATYNDPALSEKLAGAFKSWFGDAHVIKQKPTMGGEDFSEYGRTEHKIPICMFQVGNLSEEQTNKSTHLFATEVMPHLRDLWSEYPDEWTPRGRRALQASPK